MTAVMGSGSWSLTATVPQEILPRMGSRPRMEIPSITYTLTLDGELEADGVSSDHDAEWIVRNLASSAGILDPDDTK